MFTGIIKELGAVRSIQPAKDGLRISIAAKGSIRGLKIGGSIAVNGVCLTVVRLSKTGFSADLSEETLRITALGKQKKGDPVNLERAIRMSDRLEGHLVLGHVDGVGTIRNRKEEQRTLFLTITISRSLGRYCIPKGSIAIDGVSLTIQSRSATTITVAIIPHTAQVTTLGDRPVGALVNLETDLFGKYLYQWRKRSNPASGG
jgi:riboflavin synthase